MSIQPSNNQQLTSFDYHINESQSGADDGIQVVSTTQTTASSAPVQSLSLSSLGTQLDAADDVDWDQVNQIKQAISNGELSVDLDSLTQSILEMHQV